MALWSADVVNDVSRPFASYVVGACLSRLQKEATEFPLKPDESFALLHDLAAAWAVLPLSIQLNCPFSLHAGKGARVKALFSTLAEEGRVAIADQVRGWAEAYVDWVHDRPDDARQLIENREVRDLKTLDGHFRALIDADTRGEIQPRGESEMSKRKRSSPPAEQ